ncbi:hydroxymethylglutaryl-CoA lyase [Nocardioides szechwanensis]|uniref:Hydroxymethylglutaryl-CoA lyase n=1 Tax=Nocardioides szechwanensis TaxID=1005944 RepID=A0A1H0CUD7_9ACTN|nr:hydroxymethylglutaryl-CoA lyase [Nocardioides szechwanensis]GEP33324.1 hydroxymethylglutaryl-CoA lyase [Nocardioides szechwanensis]SDN61528.1 hydroxymethylglutaryl-CoA lyase [Nocardioides szechwanensis]
MTGVLDVDIREVAPRDGLQIEKPVSTAAKARLIAALVATGVRRIEATAFVSPRAVPAMADASEVAELLSQWPDVEFSALVASPGGARRAVAAGITRVEYVVSASDTHSQANARRSTAEALAQTAEVADTVHGAGGLLEVIVAMAWDCPFEGRTPVARTVDLLGRAHTLGADSLCLGDTIGTATPVRVGALVGAAVEAVPGVPLGAHFHDTYGSGLASAWAAYQAGVRRLDASAGGLGGCPFAPGASGNIATEELVHLFEDGGLSTGIDLDACVVAAEVAADVVGHAVPSRLLRAVRARS